MADIKFSQLVATDPLTGAEIVPVVQAGANKRASANSLANYGSKKRGTIVGLVGSLGNNATANLALTNGTSSGYFLYKIETSSPAWVRLYVNEASRTADAGRLISADPSPSSGVVAEAITTIGNLTTVFAPAVPGWIDYAGAPSYDIPIAVTNTSGGTATITVTLTVVPTETYFE
jgi:hypothetical protein